MLQTQFHHIYADISISLALFKDVKNVGDIKQRVMNGEFEVTLLKPQMVADPFQVLVAANRAVYLKKTGKMTTKNVHSEVLFCLSPTKNISDSFRKFGVSDTDDSVFLVLINDADNAVFNQIKDTLQGTQVPVENVSTLADESLIKKVYKVTDAELSCCRLSDALVSKIASKEFVTV